MPLETLTAETLGALLRDLSYKQRNGVLNIEDEHGAVRLSFQEGKIVAVQRPEQSATVEICRRLQRSGLLPEKVVHAVANSKVSVSQLAQLLTSKGYVREDQFSCARQGYEFDLLYSLADLRVGRSEFSPRLVRAENGFALCVFPGIVLIDLLEFAEDEERFQLVFGGWESETVVIEQKEDPGSRLSETEQMVYQLAAYGAAPGEILAKSLLSVYQVQQALLALHDQELISIRQIGSEDGADIFGADGAELGGSGYKHQADDAIALLKEMHQEEVLSSSQIQLPVEAADRSSADAAASGEKLPEPGATGSVEPAAGAGASCREARETADSGQGQHLERASGIGAVSAQNVTQSFMRGWFEHAFAPHDPAVSPVEPGVVISTLAFLMTCALIVPQLFEAVFHAINDLTSRM